MTRVLKRPMFRIGGPANEGITSGLAPRQGYALSTSERLRKAAGQQPDTSLSQFMIDWGLNMASATPSGSIFSTAAQEAKAPYQGYKASKAARAGFERDIGLEAAKIDIGQENKMVIQELQNQGKIDVAEIANNPANTATGLKIKELQGLFPDGGSEYERRLKDVIAGTSTEDDLAKIAAALITAGQDPEEAAKMAIKIYLSIQAGIGMTTQATGGRVGHQMGNAVTGAMPVQASATETIDTPTENITATETVTEGQQASVQMPYQEFRAAIPAEVSDEIVQLIYYNQDAFADFAQISTQADVYDFNNKYGVSLVLPMDTETT